MEQSKNAAPRRRHRRSKINVDYWGVIFIIPFFLAFFLFTAVPLFKTFVYSFQNYYFDTGSSSWVGPTFAGWDNYANLFTQTQLKNITFFGITFSDPANPPAIPYILILLTNTICIWILGFVPQIIVSLLLSIWFTSKRLRIRLQGFFKTVMYLPNLIMASAFALLFQFLFMSNGPVVQILKSMGILHDAYAFLDNEFWLRAVIAFINFLSWFGNTTLLLMSGVMGIDNSVYESAYIDGASSTRVFWSITMPLLKPIFIYVFITSLIGGIQLFDVAYIITSSTGGPTGDAMTLMMQIYTLLYKGKNYGQASALSIIMFLITAVLSFIVFRLNTSSKDPGREAIKAQKRRLKEYKNCPGAIAEQASLSEVAK